MVASSTKLSEAHPATVLFLGKPCPVEVRRTPMSIHRVTEAGGRFLVLVPASVDSKDLGKRVREALCGWLRAKARHVLESRVMSMAMQHGLTVQQVNIKELRSRWGSCSIRGVVNFNWRLIMTPPPVLDYLVVHELAHLREMNHSERFWKLVGELCPEYRSHQTWLKNCGGQLFHF